MATKLSVLGPSDTPDRKKPPTDLPEVIRDLTSMKDYEAQSRHLVQRIVSFASDDIGIVEIDQTQLRLLRADGTCCQFRLHPQGMEIDWETGLFYITAVEIIEQRDVARQYCGKGRAHLFECDIEGRTIRSVNLTSDSEEEYHPSGMALIDGTMFIALAQYLPETSATIIKFNVEDWTYEKLFRIQDHVGLVVPNLAEGELLLGAWGSRHYYCTDLKGNIKSRRPTPCSDDMEHQDAQLIGRSMGTLNSVKLEPMDHQLAGPDGTMMLATGVGKHRFGLDIIDITSWNIKRSLRWPSTQHLTKGGWAPFSNPTFLWVDSHDRVLALAAPDDHHEEMGKSGTLVLYRLSQSE